MLATDSSRPNDKQFLHVVFGGDVQTGIKEDGLFVTWVTYPFTKKTSKNTTNITYHHREIKEIHTYIVFNPKDDASLVSLRR